MGDSSDVNGFDSEFARDALDVGNVDLEFHGVGWGKGEKRALGVATRVVIASNGAAM
jgi:hypothetical protein